MRPVVALEKPGGGFSGVAVDSVKPKMESADPGVGPSSWGGFAEFPELCRLAFCRSRSRSAQRLRFRMRACVDTDSADDTAGVLLTCGDNPAGVVGVISDGPGVKLREAVAKCPTSLSG